MKIETKDRGNETRAERGPVRTGRIDWRGRAAAVSVALAASLGVLIYSALADVPQPVLRIEPLGTNQFNIIITNGVTTTNYTLFWTPVLADTNYLWVVLWGGEVGETNFPVNGGEWPVGYFKVMIGHDLDGDAVPVWQDANDNSASIGALSVTIDSPTNGFTFY